VKRFPSSEEPCKCFETYPFSMGTDNAIFRLISGILNSLNHRTLVSGIFCDLEKAFYCVSHKVLLDKLKYYGVNDRQYNLYKSYLQDRFQRSSILNGLNNKKVLSEWVKAAFLKRF
jgi:hypothetical protein